MSKDADDLSLNSFPENKSVQIKFYPGNRSMKT